MYKSELSRFGATPPWSYGFLLGKLIYYWENRRQPIEINPVSRSGQRRFQVAGRLSCAAMCSMEPAVVGQRFRPVGNMRRSVMPVLLLWAVPAVIVVGGVGYYLVRAVH
jgi:hypothetical protein